MDNYGVRHNPARDCGGHIYIWGLAVVILQKQLQNSALCFTLYTMLWREGVQ